MGRPETFADCRCPACQRPLDDVATDATECPFCHEPINRLDVWSTRREPDEVHLPGWLRAFGWPFLLMAAGIGGTTVCFMNHWFYWGRLSGGLFAIGFIYFLYRLVRGGEDPW